MIIKSDWHIHSEYSHDATQTLEHIASRAKELGLERVGITDHVNINDTRFLAALKESSAGVSEFQKTHPEVVLGVELTPIEKPEFDYLAKNGGIREGYVAPETDKAYDIELAVTKEELINHGVRYAIGASHWRVDFPRRNFDFADINEVIKEWYRQQMWLACDERVTILGHPWYNGSKLWYQDFSVIPHSMNKDIAAALKENGKYVECNAYVAYPPESSEKYRYQYAEFLRELFEMGIPVTYGSDEHGYYSDRIFEIEKLLSSVGFKEGDISGIAEKDLW